MSTGGIPPEPQVNQDGTDRSSGEGALGAPSPGPALRIAHLSKTFPGTRALIDVSFDVAPGQIHALLGGNGSGKSTLIKILAGVYHGDAGGTIEVAGTTTASDQTTPGSAKAQGLHFVHQNAAVFPALSVADNIAIGSGFDTTRVGSIRRRALRRRTQALLDRYDIDVSPDTLVQALRPAERAMVAIVRAVQDQEGEHSGVLVLDEPTASLPAPRSPGSWVRSTGSPATARPSCWSATASTRSSTSPIGPRCCATVGWPAPSKRDEISENRLIELIAGRALDRMYPEMPAVTTDEVALEVKGLTGGPLRGVDLQLRKGEVLGIAGLLGSGRSELLKMIFGAYPVRSGTIEVDGRPQRFRHIGQAMDAGVAYVPEDRGGEAVFPELTLSENLAAAMVDRYWHGLRLHRRQANAEAREAIGLFFIRTSSERQEMGTLSGGNQQKVILARWLQRHPKVLLLDEPTQGVDVNARAEIYALVSQAVDQGCSVLLVTSDFEELARVSDRVVVLTQGRVSAELRPPDIEPIRLTELALRTQEVAS